MRKCIDCGCELQSKAKRCDPCRIAHAKAYHQKYNAEHPPTRTADYKEKQARIKRERYAVDPEYREKRKASAYKWRDANPEQAKEIAKTWQKENHEYLQNYLNEYARNRRATDPEYRERCLASQSRWRLRNWKPAENTDGWIRHVDGVADPSILPRLRAWQNGRCYLCNCESSEFWVEHIIPRGIGGPNINQNIVYSCVPCQISRQKKLFGLEWAPPSTESCSDALLTAQTVDSALRGIDFQRNNNHWRLTGPLGSKNLYILSSFQASERNPYMVGRNICEEILASDPDAIILIDHEWYRRQSACLNMLKSKIGLSERGFGARQLTIEQISQTQADEFLIQHHVMGTTSEKYRIALMAEGVVWGLGLFSEKENNLDCVRLAFRGHVPGGMSKIMNAALQITQAQSISTFVDSRYASGLGHETVGFRHAGYSPPTYLWVFPDRIQHQRYLSNDNKCSKNLLYFNPEKSIEENIRANGVFKLWLPRKHRLEMKRGG